MSGSPWSLAVGLAVICCASLGLAGPAFSGPSVRVLARPTHTGRISPMLFGNFVELLDDLVPAMWAEMLNDRGFEGVTRPSNWCFYQGEPNFCDREWEANRTWSYDTDGGFNGNRCVKLTARPGGRATIGQAGLYVRRGMSYLFSGYLRSTANGPRVRVVLKSMLPDGKWAELASANMPRPSEIWRRYTARMVASGTTDRAVFELEATGSGDLWADKLSLMPSDNRHGWRADVVEAVRDMRPGIIRWGGSVCDPGGYRWKTGIGDRDLRTPFPNTVWGRIDSNDVGIDEFCRFCEMVGAEPLVCLSFSDGPESAADLVQYCNSGSETKWGAVRAANGHSRPYRVKYWQLGNELGDTGYVDACPEFCDAMRQADPTIVLMASFPSKELLDRVGREIAYIAPHHYTTDLASCESDIRNLSAMIRTTPGCSHVRIAVTEWNITAGSWGLQRGKMLTLDCAVQNARYLNLLMRHSDIVDIACRSNMANSMCSGVIETTPAGLLKRPSYYTMKLYAEHTKPVAHTVEGAPEGVDIAACASENGERLCVFAVNSQAEPLDLALDLSDFGDGMRATGGEVVRDTLDQRQPEVMNHWVAPDRVRTTDLDISAGRVQLPALSVSAIECSRGG